jgi:hypothetical protein
MVRAGGPPTTVFTWRIGCKVMGGPPVRTMTEGGVFEALLHALGAFPHFCLDRLAGFLVWGEFGVPE